MQNREHETIEGRNFNVHESTGKEILLVAHVDDILILGDMKLVNALFEELKTNVLLKLVGTVQKINEEFLSVVGTQKPEEGNLVQCIIVQMRKE